LCRVENSYRIDPERELREAEERARAELEEAIKRQQQTLDSIKKLDYPLNILKNKKLTVNHLEDLKKAKNPHQTPPILVAENMPSSQPPSRQMQFKGLSKPADPTKKRQYDFIEPIHKQISLKDGV